MCVLQDAWYGEASRIWTTHFGRTRKTWREREHKGLPQPKRKVDGSEVAYLRVRSAITTGLLGSAGDVLPQRTDLLDGMEPTAEQHAEFQFNEKKRRHSQIEALLSGNFDGESVSAELMYDAELHVARLTKNQRELRNAKVLKKSVIQKNVSRHIEGSIVFFAECCEDVSTPDNLRKAGATKTDKGVHADIIIVSDLSNAPPEMFLAAGLCGAVLAAKQYFLTSGKSGGCLAFTPAVDVKRFISITDGFMDEHLTAATLICDAIELVDSKWEMTNGEEDLDTLIGPAVVVRDRRQREVISFMSRDEIDAGVLNFVKHRMTLEGALESNFVCKLDPSRCLTGACTDF